jgi:ferredoxin
MFSDPVSQQIINKEVFSLIDSRERSSSISDSQRLMEKKIAAKKRQLELLNQQKAKQSALMKKFAIEEGMHEEGDKMECEPSELIHCSICNEACNEGQQNLFGVMIYAQTGSVIEDSITAKTNSLAIGKTKMETIEKPTEGALMASYRDFEREAISAFQKVYPDPSVVFSLLPYMELKTCVHYAHLDCYEKYRETVKVRNLDRS